MKPIKAITEFTFNGKYYEPNDEVVVSTIEEAVRLNEKGFIEPLNAKDLQELNKELVKPKKIYKKEEE